MTHLDILIPFGLPPPEHSAGLVKELDLSALPLLTARGTAERAEHNGGAENTFARALPHEIWLKRQFGLGPDTDSSPPVATALMQAFGLRPQAGTWFVLQPVHIHIARDHLVLTDPRHLKLSEQESRTLFDMARPLFEETGKELVFGDAGTWFVRANDWGALHTSTPDAAAGHNIDIWMPTGAGERDWRKVQNEVQMHWFHHGLNTDREMRGQKPVNSIWLWGGATVTLPMEQRYTHAFNMSGWMAACAQLVPQCQAAATVNDIIAARPENGLLLLDALLEPALSNDWGRWLENMRQLEADWFAPLRDALKEGSIDRISLIFTNDAHTARFTATRSSLRKFWVKPTLSALCP